MKKNKSPGLDGFPVEFYLTFWLELKGLFLDCIRYTEVTGELSESQNQGVITLIPKPNKDSLLPDSYRPITLLNADYKIISKIINSR